MSWLSLAYMAAEGGATVAVGSVALLGFGLGSVIEGLASIIVVWRFTGVRTLSETAERRAQRAVAVTFFLLAPYIAADAIGTLVARTVPRRDCVQGRSRNPPQAVDKGDGAARAQVQSPARSRRL
ncbi:MAG TPA: hypothetical protein VIV12_29715 [Streptosporangiaceae bacterium]